jgi:hypothetical protein
MRLITKTVAAAVLAGLLPLTGAVAAPLSQGKSLTAVGHSIEQVQYRRWKNGRWIGPGVGAGVVIGGAMAPGYYDDAYGAYAAAPGYVVVDPPYRYRGFRNAYPSPQYGACTGDRWNDSAYAGFCD